MSALSRYRHLVPHVARPATRWTRLFGIAALVGVFAGLAAAALEYGLHVGSSRLIGRFADLGEAHLLRFRPMLLLLPALGGLGSGLLVRWLCPRATGHGTNILVRAFHRAGGVLPLRGPAVKAAAAVGVISCGGSAGPEGPIAALGAAIGSSFGPLFALTPRERRIMLIAGCGAGVGAIFQCPLGGALFAAGILYRDPDFETDALVPAFVASVIGYSTYILFQERGLHTLPGAGALRFTHPLELVPYALLGLVCGGVAILFSICMRAVEGRLLARRSIPVWLAPALGGLATGAVACVVPQVMDGQYAFIKNAMSGALTAGVESASWMRWAGLFAAVALAKCVATALTVGSGGSGGVLGPSLFIGGSVGAMIGVLVEVAAPGVFSPEVMLNLRQALIPVGMVGLLSATMRAPLASIVIVAEMTGGYGLIVPSMLVCVSAYVVSRRWGLNEEQVQTAAESPAHAGDAIVHMLERWQVKDLMQRHWRETVPPGATLREMVEMIKPGTRPVFAVVEEKRIVGLVSLPDIQRIMDEPGAHEAVIAADIMTDEVVTVSAEANAYAALALMARENHVVLPVVSHDDPPALLGMLSRRDIHEAVRHQIDEMRRHLLLEHEGLAAIDHEESLHQLVMGVAAPRTDNIQRLLVPIQAVGRSLRESDFRRRFGVQVIAVEQPDGTIECPPDPERPLRTDQRLVAIVPGNDR